MTDKRSERREETKRVS